MHDNLFEQLDFGAFKEYVDNDDITDISYTNNGQIWVRSLEKGSYRVENPAINNAVVEKLAFQCSNVMGTTFNNASPFLDAESPELRLNFVHESIATNGIALVIRKTPAKIRLEEKNLLQSDYITKDVHDFLIKCVEGHCNIMVCGETGSGKTEFVKYLASHTKENEKVITIEDTLELHLDKIFPQRDIVAMKTNNVASYTDVLVTCMRQNPKWILLSEVRSAEAVSAVRNSISSGHNILSTIHADKASAIPYRLYSLMETDLDVDQFLNTIYRYIQLGVHIKAYYSKKYGKFHREVDEVTEFYVDENNVCQTHVIYRKLFDKEPILVKPSAHLLEYLANQNIDISNITEKLTDRPFEEMVETAKDDHDDTSIPKTEAGIPVHYEKGSESSEMSIMPDDNSNLEPIETQETPQQQNEQVVDNSITPSLEIQLPSSEENQIGNMLPENNTNEVGVSNDILNNISNKVIDDSQITTNVPQQNMNNNLNNQINTIVDNNVQNVPNTPQRVEQNQGIEQPVQEEFKPAVINTLSIDDILGKEA